MATRFYLPISGAPAVTPTFGGGTPWDDTTGVTANRCVTTKSSTALSNVTGSASGNNFNRLARQYVSDPIAAGNITGTVKGILLCEEDLASTDAMPQCVIYVVSNDGATVRGQLIRFDKSGLSNEFAVTTLTNRKFPRNWTGFGTPVTLVTAQANDRIVIEIGVFLTVSGQNMTIRIGDTGATDLAEDETSTADNVPWIEFSANLFTGRFPPGVSPHPPRAFRPGIAR